MPQKRISASLCINQEKENMEQLAQLFKALADSSRIQILFLILDREACVSEIANTLKMSESAVSHHMRILRMNALVRRQRNGKNVSYGLMDEHIRAILIKSCEHVYEKKE